MTRFIVVADMNYGHELSEKESLRYGTVQSIASTTDTSFVVVMGFLNIPTEPMRIDTSSSTITNTVWKHNRHCICSCCQYHSIESRHQRHVEKVNHALSKFIEQFILPIEYSKKEVFMIRGNKDILNDYQYSIVHYIKSRYQDTFYYRYIDGIFFIFLDNHPTAITRFWLSILLQKKAAKCCQTPIVLFFYYNIHQGCTDTWPLHEQEAFYQTINHTNVIAIFTSSSIENINTFNETRSLDQYPIYKVSRNQPIMCHIESKGGHEYYVTCSTVGA